MVYDKIAADLAFKSLLQRLKDEGRLDFISTYVEAGQIAAIPSEKDIGQSSAVQTNLVASSVFILGHSKPGYAQLGDENGNYGKINVTNPKNVADGIIAATALSRASILVTDDVRLTNRLKRIKSNLVVYSFEAFKAWAEAQPSFMPTPQTP